MADGSFLGAGWSFPVALRSKGTGDGRRVSRIAMSAEARSVAESIRIILGTARGERLVRPDFGADLKRLAFAPNNAATAGLAIFHVREALRRWEPRIELLGVDADPDAMDPTLLLITIEYRIVSNNTEENLVYPFYLGQQ